MGARGPPDIIYDSCHDGIEHLHVIQLAPEHLQVKPRRSTIVFLPLIFWIGQASPNTPQHFQMPPSHFLPESKLPYLKWKRRKNPFMRTQFHWYFRRNTTVFIENKNLEQPARLDLELFWGKLINMHVVNAIMARVIYVVRVYPGYLVLKNDNKIQIFYI